MNLNQTQKAILRNLLVNGTSSRAKLSSFLSLTAAALTLALKPLLSEGMVKEEKGEDKSRSGRKEMILSLNPSYASFAGIDIRKHHAYFSRGDFSGNVFFSSSDEEMSLSDFLESCGESLLSIGVTVRGDASEESFASRYPAEKAALDQKGVPYFVDNNVDCLSSIYSLFHPESRNFLMVKYGPGVGSAIQVNGKRILRPSELGHTLFQGKSVEEAICYLSLLGEEKEEKEGTLLLLEDESKLDLIAKALSFALYNADALLSLQKIVLAGSLLTSGAMQKKLRACLAEFDPSFDEGKLCSYPDYESCNERKGAIGAFLWTFRDN